MRAAAAVEHSGYIPNPSSKAKRSRTIGRLMLAASAGAIALAAPSIIAPARAQSLPSGCTDAATAGTPNDNDGAFDAGETITCLAPPDPVSGITTSVEDLTIIVGDAATPTAIDGIRLDNSGRVDIVNPDSSVSGAVGVSMSSDDANGIYITSAGAITGVLGPGIYAGNDGTGVTSIDVADVTGGAQGVDVYAISTAGDVTVSSTGTITAGGDGILVRNQGVGYTTVNVADVTGGAAGHGVEIRTRARGDDVTVTSTGTIYGGVSGVNVRRTSSSGATDSDTTISVNNVTGAIGDGIFVMHLPGSYGDIAITATGVVQGGDDGVYVYHGSNTGDVSISVNEVQGGDNGIVVDIKDNNNELDLTATGAITGGANGILIDHDSLGMATVNVADVTGGAAGVDISAIGAVAFTSSGTVSGGTGDGIYVRSEGTISIDVNNVLSDGGNGIYIVGNGYASDLALTATGAVTGGANGILIDHNSSGMATISVADVAGGAKGVDISAQGAVSFTASGTVSGGTGDGVHVESYDSISIGANNVLSAGGDGIDARLLAGANGDLTVTATGDVNGRTGVRAANDGFGDTYIGVYNAFGDSSDAVRVLHGGGDLTVVSTGTLDASAGGRHGLYAVNSGDGETVISVNNALGDFDRAVDVLNTGSATGLTLTATGMLASNFRALSVHNDAQGATVISVNDVDGADGFGVLVRNFSTASDLSFTATGDVRGDAWGVHAENTGAGETSVSVHNVYSKFSHAVYAASNGASGSGVTVTATGVLASERGGLNVRNGVGGATGGGATVISVNEVDGGDRPGIRARNAGFTTTDLILTATGSVTSSQNAVDVANYGTGATVINVAGVSSASSRGILAGSSASTTDVSITATGLVEAYGYGVELSAQGAGAAVIDLNNVSSASGRAVDITSAGTSLNLDVSGTASAYGDAVRTSFSGSGDQELTIANAASASGYGVNVLHLGGGDLRFTSTGTISGDSFGVAMDNSGSGSSTTLELNNAYGGTGSGLYLYHDTGAGDISITVAGAVSGADGVFILNYGAGDIDIDVNNAASSYGDGVYVVNAGAGGVSVNASSVTAEATGITVIGGGGIDITAGDVTGGYEGVYAANYGTGSLTITAGSVTALAGGDAIDAYNSAFGAGLSIATSGTITSADDDGIDAANYGGYLTIMSSGSVTGGDQGIVARNFGAGALTINANDVTAAAGGDDAIEAFNSGAGSTLSVTTTGAVISAGDDGIDAVNFGADLVISTSGGPVSGYQGGIEAYNYGAGATTITVANAVTGQTEDGIFTVTGNGANITILTGGSVSGATSAIRTESAIAPGAAVNDIVSLHEGGSISGDVLLLAGDDVFNDASGQFTALFGGEGTDTLNFEATAARTLMNSGAAGNAIEGFEIFNFNAGGFDLAGVHGGLSETNFNAGTNRLSGALTSTQTTIAAGASLNAADGSIITGILNVNGTLNIGDSPGTMTVDGDVVFGPASVLPVEISGDANDLLVASGVVTLGGELQIFYLGGVGGEPITHTIIDAGAGISGGFSNFVAGAQAGLLISNTIDIDPVLFDVTVTTIFNPASSIDGLNQNQSNAGDYLIELLAESSLDPELAGFINDVGAISDAAQLASVLNEAHPEGFDAGLRYLANSQSRFMWNVINATPASASARRYNVASLSDVGIDAGDSAYAWAGVDVVGLSQGRSADNLGFDGEAFEFSAGIGGIGRGPVQFGIAGGYATFSGDTKAGLSDEVDASVYRLAMHARVNIEGAGANGHIDSLVSYAKGRNELAMTLGDEVAGAPPVQSGEADVSGLGFLTRFTVTGADGYEWAIHPYAEIGLEALHQDAADIGSAQSTALSVDEMNATRAHAGLGASYQRRIASNMRVGVSATAVHYFGDTENVFQSRFLAAPAGSSAFQTFGAPVKHELHLDAGVSYEHRSGFEVSAEAFGAAGDLNDYGARVTLSRQF